MVSNQRLLNRVAVLSLLWSLFPNRVLPNAQEDVAVLAVSQTLNSLHAYDRKGRPAGQRISFEFPESVINLYLKTALKQRPRPGFESLTLSLPGDNRVILDAQINFGRIQSLNPDLVPGPLRQQLGGTEQVKLEFQFHVSDGKLTFDVKPLPSGEFNYPAALIKEVVRALGAMQPEKVDTTQPIPLPFGLKRLIIGAHVVSGDTA
jgi:hypothetical protein